MVREAPLQYSSPNTPRVPDGLGTLLLSVVSRHPDRLNRATLMQEIEEGFASLRYAREESRAEIGSMLTGDRLRLGHDPSRHAAYVNSWIQGLRDGPREICRARRTRS